MPAQKLGINDEKVKVITVDSMTGEVVNNVQHTLTDNSPTTDSVDGSVPTEIFNTGIKQLQGLHTVSSNVSSDGTIHLPHGISASGSTISSIGDKVMTIQNASSTTLDHSSGTATVPHVYVVDSSKSSLDSTVKTILGKRPASGSLPNSVVNKVIITKNPTTSQPQAVPVQIQTVSASQTGQHGISHALIQNSPKTPTKTITITQHGVISPGKGTTMTQVVGGSSPKIPINKLPISPARTPTKITMIPVSMSGRTPQKILPAGQTLLNNNNNNNSASGVQTTITMSPSKLLKQPGTVHLIQKPIQPTISNASVVTIPARPGTSQIRQLSVQPGNMQQIHVPGNKFHYIRLAAPSTSAQGARTQVIQTRPVLSSSLLSGTNNQQQVKITIPAQSNTQVVGPRTTTSASVQRIILPATPNQVPIRPSPSSGTTQGTQVIRTTLAAAPGSLTQLAPGSTFLAQTGNQQGVQGFALVPASYLSQIQQQIQAKPTVTTTQSSNPTTVVVSAQTRQDFVPIASSNPIVSASAQSKNSSLNGSTLDGGSRPRRPCNCTKSQCLKLYCDCFANGEFCHNCNCMNCANNLKHEEERSRAIKSCLDRNPLAFHPKIGKGKAGEKDRRHNKGCNCKRSGCLKNYCECYEAKIMCSTYCKCIGCKNFEESPERKTLMHLADAAEVRVQQQTAAKTKLSSQISDLPSRPVSSITGERLPFSFVTAEVVEATCACLLAQAEEADRQRMPPVVQERMVIEEFGRCLLQIIESANRTKAPDPDDIS